MKAYRLKRCRVCGKEYLPTAPNQKYCTECRLGANRVCDANYQREHPEHNRASVSRWQKANLESRAVFGSKWRSLKYANTPISEMLTSTEWLTILAEASGHCAYCDKEAKLTLDHVIPLSKGGKHSADNVVPACSHCNSSKGNRTLAEWQAKERRHEQTEARS